jgi:hypothetical protein
MTELDDTLAAARAAYDAASVALRLAEEAAGLAGASGGPVLDQLTVKRLNVVEDDGTLRIVVGNSTHARMIPIRGRQVEHPGRTPSAGLLFMNDEGTECGGLQYSGGTSRDGTRQTGCWTVDDYEQNEGVRLGMVQDGQASERFVEFVDRPAWSIVDLVEELEGLGADEARAVSARYAARGGGSSRMRLAREEDGSVGLVLRDGQGRDRLRLVVPAEGEPVVEVVDVEGGIRSLL